MGSLVCVGLDPEFERIPARFKDDEWPLFAFNRWIIEQTHAYAAAYKPNMAFYEARGTQGLRSLELTMEYLRQEHPEVFTICDAKRGDIGNTNRGYAVSIFDAMGFDAVTLHPYLGREALTPFLERRDKVSIVLCRTSNPGAGELQDLVCDGRPLVGDGCTAGEFGVECCGQLHAGGGGDVSGGDAEDSRDCAGGCVSGAGGGCAGRRCGGGGCCGVGCEGDGVADCELAGDCVQR